MMESSGDGALVEALAAVWESMSELGDGITAEEWDRPTECPGWTVRDNLSHVIGIESVLLGRPAPDHDLPPDLPHVRNDMGRTNEVWVDARRARTGREVLAEFRAVAEARLAALRDPGYDFGAGSWTPVGPGTVRDLLPFRIFDSWCHEQDMRRALGRPGDFGPDSAAARWTVERLLGAMPRAVGKGARPPGGTTVAFRVGGPVPGSLAVEMVDGRAVPLEEEPPAPTVRLDMDGETLLRLGTGRGDPAGILASGDVRITGDRALGEQVVAAMNFLF